MSAHPRFHSQDTSAHASAMFEAMESEVKTLLGNSGRDLISQLCQEAPGTFLHSWRVLQLMEAADLIAGPRQRAAVICHDIGKLVAPARFAENATADCGKPAGWMIGGHVDFGAQLACDADLDVLTMSAILEHHGTQVIEADRRYCGNPPRLPFTCALMMADTFEAMASAGELVIDTIWDIYTSRMRDGQFDLLDSWTCETITRSLIQAARELGWVRANADADAA